LDGTKYSTCREFEQTAYAFGSTLSVFAIQASAGAQPGRLAMVVRLGYHLEPQMKEMASA
jgi:hypothetical protein